MNIQDKAIQTLRVLSVEEINAANSGHPGIALGAASLIHSLYYHAMNIDPAHSNWINRDRFVLAGGHGSSLLYSMLHLAGYKVSIDDLKAFRKLHSTTPGHPELGVTDGVDVSSGPLGQGLPTAVGMAIAEAHLHAKFPSVINHYTYVICTDGEFQEGVAYEGMSLAGKLGLNKLICLFDSNDIQLDGEVSVCFNEDIKKRMEALNWNYELIEDGNNVEAIVDAINRAKAQDKPTMIECKTIIGYGCVSEGTSKCHGNPLGQDEVNRLRGLLGGDAFDVDDDVKKYYSEIAKKGSKLYANWGKGCKPAELAEVNKMFNGEFNIDYDSLINEEDFVNAATRSVGGKILDALNNLDSRLIGGSADLIASTKVKGADGNFSLENRLGRNIMFGVREHAMAAICNGIAIHGGLIPFCSGFFVFSDYAKPAIRLAAMQHLPVVYIFSHDSIAVGEDGPTHQPVEQLTGLRSIPNLNVIRPADAHECIQAYKQAFTSKNNPTFIALTRQNTETLPTHGDLSKGAYVVRSSEADEGILIATGSEVALALHAADKLAEMGHQVRVVSMPSMYLFDKQDKAYQEEVLPLRLTKRLGIEMGEAAHLYKYIGLSGDLCNINRFGVSGKYQLVMPEFGFSVENIVERYLRLK